MWEILDFEVISVVENSNKISTTEITSKSIPPTF
jgi:hypothetical protein